MLGKLGLDERDYPVDCLFRRGRVAVAKVVDRLGQGGRLAAQDGVGVVEDAVARAPVVVAGQVKARGVEDFDGLLQAGLIDAGDESLVDPLVGVGEADDGAALGQGLDNAPLIQVGVLELVHDDERVPAAVQAPQRGAALQQGSGDRRELVEHVGPAAGQVPGLGVPVAVVIGLARVLRVRRQEHRRGPGQQRPVRADEVHEERVERADLQAVAHGAREVLGDAVGDLPDGGPREGQEHDPLLGFQRLQGPGGLEQRDGGLAAARPALDQQVARRVEYGAAGVVEFHHAPPGTPVSGWPPSAGLACVPASGVPASAFASR